MGRSPIAHADTAPPQPSRTSTGGRLSQAQTGRQQRVIAAALQLAAERGRPDAIQMRDIAERSKVALATIYKYYSSKDQVLAVAFAKVAAQIEDDAASLAFSQDSPVERAVEMIRYATRFVEREPNLHRALLLSVQSSGRAYGLDTDLTEHLTRLLRSALGNLDEVGFQGFQRILTHVWISSLISWMNGWCNLSDIGDELEFACRWLLADLPLPSTGTVRADPLT